MRIAVGLKWMGLSGFALACLLAAPAVRGDVIVNIPAAQDVTLFGGSDATTNNTSSGPGMFVGSDGTSPKRGIIEFNIAAYVPAGATITGVTMTLYNDMVAGSGGTPGSGDQTARTIRLFDVTTAWNPSTLGTTGYPGPGFGGTGHGFKPPNPGDATWNYAKYNSVPWTTPGGDFSSTESADTSVNAIGSYSWTSTQMVADVQAWLDGTAANDGWLLKNDDETDQDFRAFYTREGAAEQDVPGDAPNLSVSYTVVPDPGSVLLLAVGAFILLGGGFRHVNRRMA